MILKKLSIALAFMMSLSAVGGLSTSAMALGFSDLLEAGKGHIKDLGDRWNHEDMYIDGDEHWLLQCFVTMILAVTLAHWTDGTVRLSLVPQMEQTSSNFMTISQMDLRQTSMFMWLIAK